MRLRLLVAPAFVTFLAFLLPARPATAEAGPERRVGLVYTAPRCPDTGSANINLVSILFDHFQSGGEPGRAAGPVRGRLRGLDGNGALTRGDVVLLPPDSAADTLAVGRFLASASAATTEGTAAPRREIIEADIPVLDSPYETLFQTPWRGHFDWLGLIAEGTRPNAEFPDVRPRRGDLVRYVPAVGPPVVALELRPESGAPAAEGGAMPALPTGPIESWRRQFTAMVQVDAPDDHVRVWSVGRRLGMGGRVSAELAARRLPGDLFLHPGAAAGRGTTPPSSSCAAPRSPVCGRTRSCPARRSCRWAWRA